MAREATLQTAVGEAQNEVLLPSQLFGPGRKQEPEQQLMIAVLHDALDCLEKHRSAKRPRDRQLFNETQQWFLTRETRWPYSFESICAVLDLNPDAVRQHLRVTDPQTVGDLHAALFPR